MTQIHTAAASYHGRWDDATKNWEEAVELGAHVEAKVIADVIVDTPEEIDLLPNDEPVIVPEENVGGPVINEVEKEDETEVDPEDAPAKGDEEPADKEPVEGEDEGEDEDITETEE
jgi:hypothetical protein